MAHTKIFTQALQETAKVGLKHRRERGDEAAAEIFEAWMTVALAGLIDTIGFNTTRALLFEKLGEFPPRRTERTTPKLIWDNCSIELPNDMGPSAA